jgi:hypothetical protein
MNSISVVLAYQTQTEPPGYGKLSQVRARIDVLTPNTAHTAAASPTVAYLESLVHSWQSVVQK